MRILIVVGLLMAATAGGAVIGAQHIAPTPDSRHQICGPIGAEHASDAAARKHAGMLAAKLELKSEQRATVERISAEACATMAKYHEEVLAVLTPEQRTALSELHDSSNGLHAWLRRLHGGR